MSSDRDALLAAVHAAPDDDLPRLVLADWLDEHGEPEWAAFIRGQVESAGLPDGHPDRAIDDAEERPGSPAERLGLPFAALHRRGFVAEIAAGVEDYLAWAGELAPYAPRLTVRLIRDREPDDPEQEEWAFARLAACPHLAGWYELDLDSYGPTPQAFERLATSPHTARLRRLTVGTSLGNRIARVAGPTFDGLRWLCLNHAAWLPGESDRFTADDWLRDRAARNDLPALEELYFAANGLTPDGLRTFAEASGMTRLRTLGLEENAVGDGGLTALAKSDRFPELTDLRLMGCRIEPAGVAALAVSPLLGQLTALDLSRNRIGNTGVRALANSAWSAGLVRLNVSGCMATAAGLLPLVRSPHLARLRELTLDNNPIDRDLARELARPETLPQLDRLALTLPRGMPDRAALIDRLARRFGDRVEIDDGDVPF